MGWLVLTFCGARVFRPIYVPTLRIHSSTDGAPTTDRTGIKNGASRLGTSHGLQVLDQQKQGVLLAIKPSSHGRWCPLEHIAPHFTVMLCFVLHTYNRSDGTVDCYRQRSRPAETSMYTKTHGVAVPIHSTCGYEISCANTRNQREHRDNDKPVG